MKTINVSIIDVTFNIINLNQEVLDSLEARGHAVSLVDKFGSVVVGIGQYSRFLLILIVLHYHHK